MKTSKVFAYLNFGVAVLPGNIFAPFNIVAGIVCLFAMARDTD